MYIPRKPGEATFDPKAYWEKRGGSGYMYSIKTPDYPQHFFAQEAFIKEVLNRTNPKSLLDFGCGTGKFFFLWRQAKIPEVSAYEISNTMIFEAQKLAVKWWGVEWHPEDCPVKFHCEDGDRKKLPYKDAEFDLVVACEVLAHVLPSEIEGTVCELARIIKAGGHLAVVTAAPFDGGAEHNFNHDYKSLLEKDFKITYDQAPKPYRHILCERK